MADNQGINLKTFLVIAVLMIIVAGVTSYVFMSFFTGRDNDPVSKIGGLGPTYNLGDFVVNLSGSGGYQYIQASIVVEVDQEKVVAELEKRSPQIRDNIISILREQKIRDIEEPGAKVIKNQIIFKLNEVLNTGNITNVWFTQLVVQ